LCRDATPGSSSDTPAEMREHLPIVRAARGRVLINGLGLGMVVAACLDKPDVEHVTVVELAPEVIELVADHYLTRYGSRLTVVQADAFAWEPPADAHYAAVWHDIWSVVSPENLLPMRQLREKYRGRTDW
jgi:spermidine synthase